MAAFRSMQQQIQQIIQTCAAQRLACSSFAALLPSACTSWAITHSFHIGMPGCSAVHTSAPSLPPADGEQQQQDEKPSSSLPAVSTEQQLAELFDQELQQRLAAAAAARSKAAGRSEADAASTTTTSSSSEFNTHASPAADTAADGQLGHLTAPPLFIPPISSSSSSWQQPAARPWAMQSPPLPPLGGGGTSWNPLVSADPWAPLPSPALARQQLPHQVLRLLRQAGVSQQAAAEAALQLDSSHSNSSSSSSSSSSVGDSANSSSPSSTSSSRTLLHPRRLFGSPEDNSGSSSSSESSSGTTSPAQPQQPQQQQQQTTDPRSVLSRLQTKQLVQLLEECQAPTYGDKRVLLDRLMLLLQEQQQQQQQSMMQPDSMHQQQQTHEQQQHQHQRLQDEEKRPNTAGTPPAEAQTESPQQQQLQQQLAAVRSKQPSPQLAAQQARLASVLDVVQIGKWLLAARAQDVAVVDVRGRAGVQTHLVVATGLNQRHTRALAEAVAWQLQQAAQQLVDTEQQHQQERQHEGLPDADAEGQQQQERQQEQQELEAVMLPDQVPQQLLQHQQQQQHQRQQQQLHTKNKPRKPPPASAAVDAQLLPPLNVVGDASSDWCLLHAGPVTVHVLTERARRFYALEALCGGREGRHVKWLRLCEATQQRTQRVVETKDTIGRPMGGSVGVGGL